MSEQGDVLRARAESLSAEADDLRQEANHLDRRADKLWEQATLADQPPDDDPVVVDRLELHACRRDQRQIGLTL